MKEATGLSVSVSSVEPQLALHSFASTRALPASGADALPNDVRLEKGLAFRAHVSAFTELCHVHIHNSLRHDRV